MQWHVFTYYQDKSKIPFEAWLERLLNELHAENMSLVGEQMVSVYHPSNYDDIFNSLGNPL